MPAKPFELGLALSGTISAGAYTAGVLDFLIQALDAWHALKAARQDDGIAPGDDEACLRHEVRLKVIAGASGGGMTAALAALALQEAHAPITSMPGALPDDATVQRNRLYRTWVRGIDAVPLLDTRDLGADGAVVRSLLDSTILDDLSTQILDKQPPQPRGYVDDPLHLFLTHTNLRGVPYDIRFRGTDRYGLRLSMHADHVHFVLSPTAPSGADGRWLDPDRQQREHWELARLSALGTGAWPIGLRPRQLTRRKDEYIREWPVPQDPDEKDACLLPQKIEPSWPGNDATRPDYTYLVVDGGVMNNDPVELARQCLSGALNERNDRRADRVDRAVVMVDPLSGGAPMTDRDAEGFDDYDILNTFTRMFSSLLNQARFKPDELMLGLDEQRYSRFLVAPRRELEVGSGPYARFPLATASFGAFGGFLSERFRYHDFQLGRRNCQKFLRDWFALPLDAAKQNPVFADVRDVLDAHAHTRASDGRQVVPLIPLCGSAQAEVFPVRLVAPGFRLRPDERARIAAGFNRRLRMLAPRLIDRRMPQGFQTVAKILVSLTNGRITDWAMNKLDDALDAWAESANTPV